MTIPQTVPSPITKQMSPIPGLNVLLVGDSGTGKTYSLRTLADAGLHVFCLFVEPGMDAVLDDRRIRWNYIPPGAASWQEMLDNASKLNKLSNEALQKMTGVGKEGYTQFLDILSGLHNFYDQNTKKYYGDVSTWGTNRVIVIDAFTGLGKASMDLCVGAKPIKTQPDWGVAMDNLERLLIKLTNDTFCHLVVTAHIEPERDEVTGQVKNMVATLGRKLAPTIPRHFSDVILTYREADKWYWSTTDTRTTVKTRNLAYRDKLSPSFVPLVEAWKAKGGIISPWGAQEFKAARQAKQLANAAVAALDE
jgi:hypothetical protein